MMIKEAQILHEREAIAGLDKLRIAGAEQPVPTQGNQYKEAVLLVWEENARPFKQIKCGYPRKCGLQCSRLETPLSILTTTRNPTITFTHVPRMLY
jgi:hypothetical protein